MWELKIHITAGHIPFVLGISDTRPGLSIYTLGSIFWFRLIQSIQTSVSILFVTFLFFLTVSSPSFWLQACVLTGCSLCIMLLPSSRLHIPRFFPALLLPVIQTYNHCIFFEVFFIDLHFSFSVLASSPLAARQPLTSFILLVPSTTTSFSSNADFPPWRLSIPLTARSIDPHSLQRSSAVNLLLELSPSPFLE